MNHSPSTINPINPIIQSLPWARTSWASRRARRDAWPKWKPRPRNWRTWGWEPSKLLEEAMKGGTWWKWASASLEQFVLEKKHYWKKNTKKSSKTTSNHQTTHQKSPQNHQKQANFGQEECLQVEQRLTPLLQRTEQRIDVQEQELKLVAGAMGMWWGFDPQKMRKIGGGGGFTQETWEIMGDSNIRWWFKQQDLGFQQHSKGVRP